MTKRDWDKATRNVKAKPEPGLKNLGAMTDRKRRYLRNRLDQLKREADARRESQQ